MFLFLRWLFFSLLRPHIMSYWNKTIATLWLISTKSGCYWFSFFLHFASNFMSMIEIRRKKQCKKKWKIKTLKMFEFSWLRYKQSRNVRSFFSFFFFVQKFLGNGMNKWQRISHRLHQKLIQMPCSSLVLMLFYAEYFDNSNINHWNWIKSNLNKRWLNCCLPRTTTPWGCTVYTWQRKKSMGFTWNEEHSLKMV